MLDNPNIIFIIIDTLRKDYAASLEKELKKFGFRSYKNVIAPAPWTTPSHASMFTGFYPLLHGAHETKDRKDYDVKLAPKHKFRLISNVLRELEFKNYLLNANPHITPYFGFYGFREFYDVFSGPYYSFTNLEDFLKIMILKKYYDPKTKYDKVKMLLRSKEYRLLLKILLNKCFPKSLKQNKMWPLDKGAKKFLRIFDRKIQWNTPEPKFIFVNLMEMHEPYLCNENPEEISRINFRTGKLNPEIVKLWRRKYAKELQYTKHNILKLIKILKDNKVLDSSVVIVTSDHGQLLGEHGRIRHGTFLYDELIKVPLLIKYPPGHNPELDTSYSLMRYVTLVNLYHFILNIINGNFEKAERTLFSEVVFSESYGIEIPYNKPKNPVEMANIEQLEKYRIAIYYKRFKGIFNVTDWKFDRIFSYDPKMEVTENVKKELKRKVINFLKSATRIPKGYTKI